MPAGYSSKPLLKKLGIKAGFALLLIHEPDDYLDLLGNLPEGSLLLESADPESADFIHLFCTRQEGLEDAVPTAIAALKKTGMLWVSWPKGNSTIPTDLKRDPIRSYMLDQGLVDVKVTAVDENWSGLKFVYRLKDR